MTSTALILHVRVGVALRASADYPPRIHSLGLEFCSFGYRLYANFKPMNEGMNMSMESALIFFQERGMSLMLRLAAALAIWFIGRWLISFAVSVMKRAMVKRNVDATLVRYAESALKVILTVVLVVALMGFFGVETTSFAALLAGVGLAIGTAWGGLLQHFAAGVFMVALRPFRVGDEVTVAGVTGTVEEIGLVVTTINTFENVRTTIGNNKVFGDTIQNYSANGYRRVDVKAQLAGDTDYNDAIERFREKVVAIPNVLQNPAPVVAIVDFNLAGPVVAVRPYAKPEHFWDVWFATHRAVKDVFTEAGYTAPGSGVTLVGPNAEETKVPMPR